MHRLRFVTFAFALLFAAGCAQQKETAPMAEMKMMCPISHEAVDDQSSSVQFEGKTVRFCCDKCVAEWNGMDDAKKHEALATLMK